MTSKAKQRPHYVDNKKFSLAVVEYVETVNEAREADSEIPKVTDYIATCFMKISEGLSHRPNFVRYTYREEMVMDAVENCLKAIENYNINATTRTGKPNAFAYFTQIIWYAFLRRISKEKKQMYIRFKSSQVMVASGGTYSGDEVNLNLNTNVDYMNSFVQDYEDKIAKDKAKKKASIEEAAEAEAAKVEDPKE